MAKDPKWLQHAGEKMKKTGTEGALHRALHVPEDKTIPLKRIEAELHKRGISTKRRKQLQFAKNAGKIARKHKAEAGHEPQLAGLVAWASEHGIEVVGYAAVAAVEPTEQPPSTLLENKLSPDTLPPAGIGLKFGLKFGLGWQYPRT